MWPTPDSLPRSTLHFAELLGGLFLANADAAQRLQFLVCRLSMGTSENCLRAHILRDGDVVYAADQAELENRVRLLLEAGAEGCVTIVRHYIEEVTAAHIRCLQGVFETGTPTAQILKLPFSAASLPPSGLRPGRREAFVAQ